MKHVVLSLFILSLLCACGKAEAPRTYLIGNSLTWDTVPSRLDGEVKWHVDCGKSLPYIFGNPSSPCVGSSTIWTNALEASQFDTICVQPHYGSTLKENVGVITAWVSMQPQAKFIIHSGWALATERAGEWERDVTEGPMKHNRAWTDALIVALQDANPGRSFGQTRAQDLLELVEQDIQAGTAPFDHIANLYRDAIHMSLSAGRYLMHNAVRTALGQPRSTAGFESLNPDTLAYLETVFERHKTNIHVEFGKQIRVLCYNIHHGEGTDRKLDLERIATIIRDTKPDLVALQEVDRNTERTENVDQAAMLAKLTGMHFAFGPNIEFGEGDYGNAILSRLPIDARENILLPNHSEGEQRGALRCEIGGMDFYFTHLDHRSQVDRLAGAKAINATVRPTSRALLAGDLNAPFDNAVLDTFRTQWSLTNDTPQPTVPVGKPTRQIDFILIRPKSAWRTIEFRVLDEAVASDHRAIFAVLQAE